MVRTVRASLLTSASALIHELLEQTLPMRRPRPCLKHNVTSANLGQDVEGHSKRKTSL